MKIKIGDCEITGRSGDFVCQAYGIITNKDKADHYGKKGEQHYFGNISQALWFVFNNNLAGSDAGELKDLMQEMNKFKEELKSQESK